MDDEKVQRVASLLRELHRSITADPPLPFDEWELKLYAYDEALVTAADIFDLDVPDAARDEMGPDDRADLEQALADAGLDVRTERGPERSEGPQRPGKQERGPERSEGPQRPGKQERGPERSEGPQRPGNPDP